MINVIKKLVGFQFGDRDPQAITSPENFKTNEDVPMNINQIPQKAKLTFAIDTAQNKRQYEITGRYAQTLLCLCLAGEQGITLAELLSPALRLSAYVHILRHKYNVEIETLEERNSSGFGSHAKYRLISNVEILSINYKGQPIEL